MLHSPIADPALAGAPQSLHFTNKVIPMFSHASDTVALNISDKATINSAIAEGVRQWKVCSFSRAIDSVIPPCLNACRASVHHGSAAVVCKVMLFLTRLIGEKGMQSWNACISRRFLFIFLSPSHAFCLLHSFVHIAMRFSYYVCSYQSAGDRRRDSTLSSE